MNLWIIGKELIWICLVLGLILRMAVVQVDWKLLAGMGELIEKVEFK